MANFTPVNSLEMKLRALLWDRKTPLWSFYTPLAASPLWIIIRHHPELDGSDLVAPPGQNPAVCVLQGPKESVIGLYTSPGRAQAAFKILKLSPHELTTVSAPGYQLLKYVGTFDAHLWINCGLTECQYKLDPDLVEILLSRPEPHYDAQPTRAVSFAPTGDADRHLAPLREFLGRQPQVRAAWIYRQKPGPARPADQPAYEISLLMENPEDNSLLREVEVMVKALTPVTMEWTSAV
ncbi:MAG: hypothetical protein ACRD3R_13640, partial [Terriglobales bacterium]